VIECHTKAKDLLDVFALYVMISFIGREEIRQNIVVGNVQARHGDSYRRNNITICTI
jgi:hypothetical protein